MEVAGAFVVAAIEVADRLDARLVRGGAELLQQLPAHARRLDPPFSANRMRFACAEKMILVLFEKRQDVAPGPAGEAELAPMVIVGRLSAHVDHGIDRGGSADHLATGIAQRTTIEPRFGLGLEHPIRARIADREEIANRNVKPDPVVLPAGLEHKNTRFRIGRKSVSKHASGRAGAYDDIVVFALDRRDLGHGYFPLT